MSHTEIEKEILLPIVLQLISKLDDIAPELKRDSLSDIIMLVDKLMNGIVELRKMDLRHIRRILKDAPIDVIGVPTKDFEKHKPVKIDKDGYLINPTTQPDPPEDVVVPPVMAQISKQFGF